MSSKAIRPIDTDSFGKALIPIQVNEKGELETYVEYSNLDLAKLLSNISWSIPIFRCTKRQSEIQDLSRKLSELIKNEKKLRGRLWIPIPINKPNP